MKLIKGYWISIFSMIVAFILVFSLVVAFAQNEHSSVNNNEEVKLQSQSANSSDPVATIAHVEGLGEVRDDLNYLVNNIDATRYAYDTYRGGGMPINDLWKNLHQYKVILVDEDAVYSSNTLVWGGYPDTDMVNNYNSFASHKAELEAWIRNGGGIFITCNNDTGQPNYLWDWLPESLQVESSDYNVPYVEPQIVSDPGLFSRPNKLDQAWISNCGGHWHGEFTSYPGYTMLLKNPSSGRAVEIYKGCGSGVIVISHAEFEAGNLSYSWQYVQNEIDFVVPPSGPSTGKILSDASVTPGEINPYDINAQVNLSYSLKRKATVYIEIQTVDPEDPSRLIIVKTLMLPQEKDPADNPHSISWCGVINCPDALNPDMAGDQGVLLAPDGEYYLAIITADIVDPFIDDSWSIRVTAKSQW